MKSLLLSNKAQLGTLQAIVVSVLLIGIVLGLGFLIFSEFSETLGDTTGTVSHEAVTLADLPGGVFVDYNSTTGGGTWCYHSFTPTVYNSTGGGTITTGNYSYEAYTGKMWNLTVDPVYMLGGVVNVSYTYQYSDSEACRALDTTVDATEEIPTWLTIIIIMLIVGALLFIVFRVMPAAGGEEEFRSSGGFSGRFSGFKGFSGGSSDTVAEI